MTIAKDLVIGCEFVDVSAQLVDSVFLAQMRYSELLVLCFSLGFALSKSLQFILKCLVLFFECVLWLVV